MSRAGKQYAEALFGLARERDRSEQVAADLRQVADLWQNADLRRVLRHPGIPAAERLEMVRGLLPDEASDLTLNLLSLLISRGRDVLLPDIADEFMDLIDRDQGLIHAEVFCPAEPDAALLQQLQSRLTSEWSRPVRLSVRIDPGLLGGMAIRVGDLWIDGSLAAQLDRLRRDLAEPRS